MSLETSPTPRAIRLGAVLFSIAVFVVSGWHWWTFQYGTFDLAFYVQALWLAVRGKWWVSLLNVPLMGNHAEPLVFLLTPLFALCPHPMLLVAVQAIVLASMAFIGFRIATRLGIARTAATALGLVLLVIPATSSVGIDEFHPEALSAPLLLLLAEARLAGRYGAFWLWFLAVLACKENLALLLVALCVVFTLLEWRRGSAWLARWNIVPMLVAAAWLAFCGLVLSPWLNAGNVDYSELYSHLGHGGGEIVKNFFFEPHRAAGALWRALTHGDMVWSLILPLLLLPLLRPRWLLIASPLLLQHLLSWRTSEWSLGTHYPAPFIPLFWIAAVEALRHWRLPRTVPFAVLAACILAHVRFGPAADLIHEIPHLGEQLEQREWKAQMIAEIPPQASVTAVQSFLSHLAEREHLYSLHHVLKGLKTLSRKRYEPPPSDVVVIDYGDGNTFSTTAGFYHPPRQLGPGHTVPSSDRLLHEYLVGQTWRVQARNELTLLTRGEPTPVLPPVGPPLPFDAQTTLLSMQISRAWPGGMQFRFAWEFGADRQRFPWMTLVASDGHRLYTLPRGACAPEAPAGRYDEEWLVVFPSSMPRARYELFALFYDGSEAAWSGRMPPEDMTHVWKKLELGHHELAPGDAGAPR